MPVDGERVVAGRAEWLMGEGGEGFAEQTSGEIERALGGPEAEGLSLLFVVRGGRLLGWVGLEDNTRPQAAAAVDRLRELGLKRLIIVTGDRESVAKRVAGQMHTEYRAQVLPGEKLQIVADLKAQGHRVAVVGDGVNDAPEHAEALAAFVAPFRDVRVNLLPMNSGRDGLRGSPPDRVGAFQERLREKGLFCAIRRPRGVERNAACGQLAVV